MFPDSGDKNYIRRMKVLFTTSARTWGGVKSWMVRVIGAMTRQGVETALIARGPSDFLEKAREAGAEVTRARFGMDYGPLAVARALFVLRRLRPGVVVTNISKEVRTYGVAAKILGVPVAARLGLGGDLPDNLRTRFDYRHFVSGAIVPALSVKAGIPAHVLSPEKIRVIHNGVPVPPEAARPGSAKGPVKVVYVGKISERKGVPYICRAGRRLLDDGLDMELHLAGGGDLLEGLRSEYRDIPRIRFYGHLADPLSLMLGAHIGVMHSSYEGFPNTLLEYMACGLAVATTPVNGVPEMLSDGAEGLFTPYGDAGALAGTLRTLAENPALRAGLGEAARARAARDFEINRQTEKVIACLRELAPGTR